MCANKVNQVNFNLLRTKAEEFQSSVILLTYNKEYCLHVAHHSACYVRLSRSVFACVRQSGGEPCAFTLVYGASNTGMLHIYLDELKKKHRVLLISYLCFLLTLLPFLVS